MVEMIELYKSIEVASSCAHCDCSRDSRGNDKKWRRLEAWIRPGYQAIRRAKGRRIRIDEEGSTSDSTR